MNINEFIEEAIREESPEWALNVYQQQLLDEVPTGRPAAVLVGRRMGKSMFMYEWLKSELLKKQKDQRMSFEF